MTDDEKKIEAAAKESGKGFEYLTECICIETFHEAVAWRDSHPSPEVVELVKALKSVTTDIQSYADANYIVDWVIHRNEKAMAALDAYKKSLEGMR